MKILHSGGIVAHSGLIVGHGGLRLGPDDVPAILQKKEWVLNRNATSSLTALGGPNTFTHLNQGRLPILRQLINSSGERSGQVGEGVVHNYSVSVTHSPTYLYKATPADYRRDAKHIVKAINKEIGNRGQGIGDGRS
jgi:hypothetical protein